MKSERFQGDWDRLLKANSENSFDALRLLLALMVVFEHSYFLPQNSIISEPLYIYSRGQLNFGAVAVDLFFVLSGFLITRSFLQTRKLSRYFQKRAARILPGFFCASLVSVLVGMLGSDNTLAFIRGINIQNSLIRILSLHPSGLSGAFEHNPVQFVIDGTLWTIRYEVDCYLLVAILGVLGLLGRVPIGLLFLLSASVYVGQTYGFIEMPNWDHGPLAILISNPKWWPRLFTYFLAGATFYLWRELIPKSYVCFAIAVLTIIIGSRFDVAEFALMTAGIYAFFFLALSTALTFRIRGRKIDLSYGIYLYGFPIQQLIVAWWLPATISPLWLFGISAPAACCMAYLSWIFVEAPSLQWAWPNLEKLQAVRWTGRSDPNRTAKNKN